MALSVQYCILGIDKLILFSLQSFSNLSLRPALADTPPATIRLFTWYSFKACVVFLAITSVTLCWKVAHKSSLFMVFPLWFSLCTRLITADLIPLKLKLYVLSFYGNGKS